MVLVSSSSVSLVFFPLSRFFLSCSIGFFYYGNEPCRSNEGERTVSKDSFTNLSDRLFCNLHF